jgi:hypothetical protein
MSRTSTPTLPFTDALAPEPAGQLPLGMARVVRVSLEGSDLAAVEAAAAELKVRFGARFAVTGRRLTAARDALRISACMMANLDTVLDAEGLRQWVVPEACHASAVEGRFARAAGRGEDESGTFGADDGASVVSGVSHGRIGEESEA